MDVKKIKLILSAVVIILLGVVIIQNYQQTTITILMASITMPLAILLALTLGIGLISGWLLNTIKSNKGKK